MRILLVRLMGLGDVASILVPATYLYRERYPEASITASPTKPLKKSCDSTPKWMTSWQSAKRNSLMI